MNYFICLPADGENECEIDGICGHGTCIDTQDSYFCECDDGHLGGGLANPCKGIICSHCRVSRAAIEFHLPFYISSLAQSVVTVILLD